MEKPGDASNVLIYSRIVSWNSVKNTIRKMSLHVILKKKKKTLYQDQRSLATFSRFPVHDDHT